MDLVKAGSSSTAVTEEIQHMEDVKKSIEEHILKLEVQTGYNKKAIYDVDVVQGALQRFATLIYKLPIELQLKIMRTIIEKVTVYKDHIAIKVPEIPVGDVQKMLDKKLVLRGYRLPERWGVKTKKDEKNLQIGVSELEVKWRGPYSVNHKKYLSRLIGKVRLIPSFILTLDLFRTKGPKHEKNLSAVSEPR